MWILLSGAAAALWLAVLCAPWRPWSTRERLVAAGRSDPLDGLTALVPARNEADLIGRTVRALRQQGSGLRIVVIDDQSSDATAARARAAGADDVLAGAPLPPGWTGKLWALEQGYRTARSARLLLVDADIELAPGVVAALLERMQRTGAALASVAAAPRLLGFWERLLLPAFVYFFKLLYPFALANGDSRRVAAAAGGCMLLERRVLDTLGGFGRLRSALIDDCTLARQAKEAGFRTWIGLSHAVRSQRACPTLASVWAMVARNAFTQLRYSVWWLLLCTVVMLLAFAVPVLALVAAPLAARTLAAIALAALMASYVPILRYYGLNALRAVTLPPVAALYLAMTWSSAVRYWRGTRSSWRGRHYARSDTPLVPPLE